MKLKNMSCLTKKSLFFLVLTIVCNTTLSNRTEKCITNVRRAFHRHLPPRFYFKLAMILINRSVVESIGSPEELVNYIKNHTKACFKYVDADTTLFSSAERDNLYSYIRLFTKSFENDSNSKNIISGKSKQPYIIGYFHYLVSKLGKIAEFINKIVMSPQQFCEEYFRDYEYALCRNALYTMLSLRGVKTETEIDEMKGYNTFIYCYKNYTYADFTTETFFPESGSSNDYQKFSEPSSSGLYLDESFKQLQIGEFPEPSNSGMYQEESIEELQIGMMVEYYDHMFFVSTKIAEYNDKEGLQLFPTVEEYCTETSVKTKK